MAIELGLTSKFVLDLQEFFAEHAASGVFVDPELAAAFAAGLADLAEGVQALEAYVHAIGLPEALEDRRLRTAAERQSLARAAAAVDPDARIVAFPIAPALRLVEGGVA